MRGFGLFIAFAAGLSAVACSPHPTQDQIETGSATAIYRAAAQSVAQSEAASDEALGRFDPNDYLGVWHGPVGSQLQIQAQGAEFDLLFVSGEERHHVAGTVSNGALTFVRGGRVYVLTRGDGEATGVASLSRKTRCLIIMTGDAYCRD